MMTLIAAFLSSTAGRFLAVVAGIAMAAGIAYGTGYVKGSHNRAALDAAAGAKAQIEFLQRQIAARDAAAEEDAASAAADKAALAKELETANAAISATSTGPCLDSDDVKRLRTLWANQHRHNPVKPAAPARRPTGVL